MKKISLLPNVITAFALSCGIFVIFKMNMTPIGEANLQVLLFTTVLLMLAAFADVLDGAIARAMKAESDFGGIFDCLADAISFGIAPSVIILKTLSVTPKTELSIVVTTAALIYSVCGVLRLVRFSVMAKHAKGDQELTVAHNKHFTGLPIPAAAAAAVSMNLLLVSEEFNYFFTISENARAWILICTMVLLGFFMVSRWKFPSIKSLHIPVRSFRLVFITVIFAIVIFYFILSHFPLIIFAIAWSYVLISWILSIIRMITGRRIKTLEEFEPEPDDLEE